METKTTITKTTQKKEVPTIVFNDDSLIETLMEVNRANMAEVVYVVAPNAKKTNNPFYDKPNKSWLIEKVVKCNGMFGTDYEKGVKKASSDENFVAQEHKWARHFNGSKVVMVNKKEVEYLGENGEVRPILDPNPTKFYAAFRPLRADNVEYRFVSSKEHLTEEETKEYKSFITPKPSSPIEWRTITISNIREIRMDGTRYQRGI